MGRFPRYAFSDEKSPFPILWKNIKTGNISSITKNGHGESVIGTFGSGIRNAANLIRNPKIMDAYF
jgi:hypothetical protein